MWQPFKRKRRPDVLDLERDNSLCPYCSARLRTPKARQCSRCLMDWHDSAKAYRRERIRRTLKSRIRRVMTDLATMATISWKSLRYPFGFYRAARNCDKICNSFEGVEAIYIEKGALLVRVSNLRAFVRSRQIVGTVEEIPVPGLSYFLHATQEPPLRWRIAAGLYAGFSDDELCVGYGGWHLFANAQLIADVLDLISKFSAELDSHARYKQIVQAVYRHPTLRGTVEVFPGPK